MDLGTQLGAEVARALDGPLGWLLDLPRDVSLLGFALITALLMTLTRRWVTNQDLLLRCSNDLRQLKRLTLEAKQSGDQPQRQRLRATVALIQQTRLAADLKVLAVVLLPVAALALWAVERLDFIPLRVGDEFVLRAVYPISAVDDVTHLVPTSEVELRSSAIQIIQADHDSSPRAWAEWTLRSTAATDELALTIRHHGQSAVHRVAVGRRTYLPPQQLHAAERLLQTEVSLRRYQPLGVDLRTAAIGWPPWMAGYLALTLLLVPVLKRVLRVA